MQVPVTTITWTDSAKGHINKTIGSSTSNTLTENKREGNNTKQYIVLPNKIFNK